MITNEFDEHDSTLSEMSDGDPAAMPLGTEDFNAQSGFVTGETPSAVKRHAGGALLLTLVVAVAIAGLFSMRTLTKASAAIDAPSEVEKSIEGFLEMIDQGKKAEKEDGDTAVLNVLSESYTKRQVALADVQRNPFIIFERTTDAAAPIKPKQQVDPRIEQRRNRTDLFERAAGRLHLGSILLGSSPLANINNQVLRVGDSITVTMQSEEVIFRVLAIEAASVDLVAEDPLLEVRVPVTVNIRRDL